MKAYTRRTFSANEKKLIQTEINKQCIEYEKMHEAELVCRSLWVLHFCFGWGAKRLTKFFNAYHEEVAELVKHYELDPSDDCWLCMKKLHDAGFDFRSEGVA